MFGWKGAERQKTHRIAESSGAADGAAVGVMTGIIAGTKIATEFGWRDVASLQPGDKILTFDNELQELRGISRTPLWEGNSACPPAFWPLTVPTGALENSAPLMLLPGQGVMLESDVAENLYGDPFALIPAEALEDVHGIERTYPSDSIDVITLQFDDAQVVFAAHGTLLFCAAGGDLLEMAIAPRAQTRAYRMLPRKSASALVQGTAELAFA